MTENPAFGLIMAGGEGTRFQPFSTPEKPKQFLPLLDREKSLLQQTYERLQKWGKTEKILVATHRRYLPLVTEQLPGLAEKEITAEAAKKNTAPTLAWVSHRIAREHPGAVLAALPADHYVSPEEAFLETLTEAAALARASGKIVTIGIPPTFPSTQYGYLEMAGDDSPTVLRFVEKPDEPTAGKYLASGRFLWNAGIFVFPVRVLLEGIGRHLPELARLLKTSPTADAFFNASPSVSIDYGLMEKLDEGILALRAPFEWSDVGTWESLGKLVREKNLDVPPEIRKHLELVS